MTVTAAGPLVMDAELVIDGPDVIDEVAGVAVLITETVPPVVTASNSL